MNAQARTNAPRQTATATNVASGVLQRKCACGTHTIAGGECESCQKQETSGNLQRAAFGAESINEVPPIVHEVLGSSGQPLDAHTRSLFEGRFAHDFSQVRVHTDAKAAHSARAVNALAYTVGHDLVFAAGEYKPQTSEGRRLLAHELAHVIQQRDVARNQGMQHRLRVSNEDDPAEREADAMAERSLAPPSIQATAQESRINPLQLASLTTPMVQRRVSPKLATIRRDLKDKKAGEVLEILKALSDEDLMDTVAAMEQEKLVDSFFQNLGNTETKENQEELRRIKNYRVYTKVTKSGATEVVTTKTGSCSFDQADEIFAAAKGAIGWLDKIVPQLDAYLSKPNDASTKTVRDALTTHFKSSAVNVATYVRNLLNHIRSDIGSLRAFTVECHGTWDSVCATAGAYVPGDDHERVVFCNSFFQGQQKATESQTKTVVHEMAHTQVGGTHIGDRAYRSDRLLKQLTTEEALTNADSYALFVQQLATAKNTSMSAPSDTHQDCPVGWKKALDKAIATAERWNFLAKLELNTLTPKMLSTTDTSQIGGATQKAIDAILNAVSKLDRELKSSISFQCEPGGGGRCDGGGRTYWYAAGDFHICPDLMKDNPDEQAVGVLAGLYGYKADVGDNTRRWNYARFAQARANEPAPALSRILGSSAWSANDLRIWFDPLVPKTPTQPYYEESGLVHERMSSNLPRYQGPACSTTLPFSCRVWFFVDRLAARPAPFTPPRVSIEFGYMTPGGPIQRVMSDLRADYRSPGFQLDTKLPDRHGFQFTKNGPFEMKFELLDPDTNITRVYEDTIQIEAERPCNVP